MSDFLELNFCAACALRNALAQAIKDQEKHARMLTDEQIQRLPIASRDYSYECVHEHLEAVKQLREIMRSVNDISWAHARKFEEVRLQKRDAKDGASG